MKQGSKGCFHCQNPNIATTQPNLNIWLGLPRLLLFTPPTTPPPGTLFCLEIHAFFVVRIKIFQASLTDSYHIGVFKPEIILRIFLFFDQVRKQNVKLVFQCTMARSQPQYDSQIILNIPRFEPHDSYKKYSYKKKSVY